MQLVIALSDSDTISMERLVLPKASSVSLSPTSPSSVSLSLLLSPSSVSLSLLLSPSSLSLSPSSVSLSLTLSLLSVPLSLTLSLLCVPLSLTLSLLSVPLSLLSVLLSPSSVSLSPYSLPPLCPSLPIPYSLPPLCPSLPPLCPSLPPLCPSLPLSLHSLATIHSALRECEKDSCSTESQQSGLTVALVASDSTILYYHVWEGIHNSPPHPQHHLQTHIE